jgi:methylated-DNA-protein-cysteine methyltransferase related protein
LINSLRPWLDNPSGRSNKSRSRLVIWCNHSARAAQSDCTKEEETMNDFELAQPERDAFYAMVWKIVRQIPTGRVATYGQVAAMIPSPKGISPDDYKAYRARWAGSAMAACPPDVPWQRVINSQGKISARRGAEQQRGLLEKEGLVFDSKDRIDLVRFAWAGPSDDWLRANGLIGQDSQPSLL